MSQTHEIVIDGSKLVKQYASWARGEHEREWMVLHRVHTHCPDLVPEPVAADLYADRPKIIMTVLPGAPLDGCLDTSQQEALAAALRQLWSVPCDNLPPRRHHPVEIHTLMANRMATLDLPGLAGEAASVARSFLSCLRIGPARTTVLGHGDLNLYNYLWDGHRVRIVDFEDAGCSDPEFELADLIEHVGARGTDWRTLLAGFDLDHERLRAARCLYATFWLDLLRPGGPAESRNAPGILEQQAERLLRLLN